MKLLELFAGSRSFGKVAETLGFEVFSTDLEPFENINLAKDIREITINDLPFIPDVIQASPPCTFFSVASIGHHWYHDNTPKTENAAIGIEIVQATLNLIEECKNINPNLKYFIENPRGKLRKLPVVSNLHRATVTYCSYGDTRMKPTDIWSNHLYSEINPNGWIPRQMCWRGNKDCHHEAAPRGSKSGTQRLKGSYNRSKIPSELCAEILSSLTYSND